MATMTMTREECLVDAQNKAIEMFEEIGKTLIRPGVMESTINKEILEMGKQRYGVRTHWHKRVIRSGPNTLKPYAEEPPDRMIGEDDILFIDLGPVFEAWEADFGRTFVLGNDPVKIKLRDSLAPVWNTTRARYEQNPDMTGEELFAIACEQSEKAGFEFGGPHSGHNVGDFPHERIPDDKISFYITKGNKNSINQLDRNGHKRHWILEIHMVDRERQIGGFMEQLLTI